MRIRESAAIGAGVALAIAAVVALVAVVADADGALEAGVGAAVAVASGAGALFVAGQKRAGAALAIAGGAALAAPLALSRSAAIEARALYVVAGALLVILGTGALVAPRPWDRRRGMPSAFAIVLPGLALLAGAAMFLAFGATAIAGLAFAAAGFVASVVAVVARASSKVAAPVAPSSARPSSPPPSGTGLADGPTLPEPESSWLRQVARAPEIPIGGDVGDAEHDALVGSHVDAFRIVARIGAGGMGVVYRAVDERLGREVALKVLPPVASVESDRRARFLREARAIARISSPYVVALFEVSPQGAPISFLAMELVRGTSLRDEMKRRGDHAAFDPRDALELAACIAEGLAAAHAAGIVHRDLKPENVLLTPARQPKLVDFGLARLDPKKFSEGGTELTHAGEILGTLSYMSPEQVRGERVGPPGDVFACGLLLGELLTGEPIVGRRTSMETIEALASFRGLPPSLAALEPPIAGVLERCLRPVAAERYPDGGALARALRAVLDERAAR